MNTDLKLVLIPSSMNDMSGVYNGTVGKGSESFFCKKAYTILCTKKDIENEVQFRISEYLKAMRAQGYQFVKRHKKRERPKKIRTEKVEILNVQPN